MADGLIDMIVPEANFDTLTATKNKVSQGKAYVGKDGMAGVGENPVRDAPDILLPVNGEVILPAGKYTGGSVGQEIPAFRGMHILPGSKEISVLTKDMYMAGAIFIDPLENLVPENIKMGEYVGGVGPGEWEGYIVTDPKTFYYRGTFAPGQSLSDYSGWEDKVKKPLRTDYKNRIEFSSMPDMTYNNGLARFDAPIDLTSLKKLEIEFVCEGIKTYTLDFIATLSYAKTNLFSTLHEETIGFKKISTPASNNGKILTFNMDISQYSRVAYLYLELSLSATGSSVAFRSIKFS